MLGRNQKTTRTETGPKRQATKRAIIVGLLGLIMAACEGTQTFTGDPAQVDPAASRTRIDSKTFAAYDPGSAEVQTMTAATGSAISGTAVNIPPGSLAIPTNIVIEESEPLQDTSLMTDLGLNSQANVNKTAPGVIVRPAQNVASTKPFSIQIPLPPLGAALVSTETQRLAVIYRVWKGEGEGMVSGLIPRSELQLADGYATFLAPNFGAFQTVVLSVEVTEKKEAKSSEGVRNANKVTVADTTGIVAEEEVVRIQAIPAPVWQATTIAYDKDKRTITITGGLSTALTLSECQATLREDPELPLPDLVAATEDELTATIFINEAGSLDLIGRYRCTDNYDRSLTSPWSSVQVVEALPELTTTLAAAITLGATETLEINGGLAPYSLRSANPEALSLDIDALTMTAGTQAGDVEVIITDTVGTSLNRTVKVARPVTLSSGIPELVVTGTPITLAAEGGHGTYSFSADLGELTGSQWTAPATPGTATIRVQDELSQTASRTVTVREPLEFVGLPASLLVGQALELTATGGMAPYTFSVASSSDGSTLADLSATSLTPRMAAADQVLLLTVLDADGTTAVGQLPVTSDPVPLDPANVSASASTDTITFSWVPGDATAILGYNVQFAGGTNPPACTDTLTTNNQSYTANSLAEFTDYSIRVCAIGAGTMRQLSNPGATLIQKTLVEPADEVGSLNLTATSATSLQASWTGPSTPAGGFHVVVSDSGSAPACGSTTTVSANNLVRNALTAGTTYHVRVCALDASLTPTAGITDSITLPTPGPIIPTIVAASETATTNSISFAIQGESTRPDRYLIVAQAGGSPTSCSSPTATVNDAGSGDTAVTIPSLTPYTSYTIVACAEKDSAVPSQSGMATAITVTTKDLAPGAPTAPSAPSVSADSIDLSWTAGADVSDGHVIAYTAAATAPGNCEGGGGISTEQVPSGSTATIAGLLDETEYSFSICGKNRDGDLSSPTQLTSIATDAIPLINNVIYNSGSSTVTTNTITIAYSYTDPGTSKVLVHYRTDGSYPAAACAAEGGTFAFEDTVLADNDYRLTGLAPGQSYKFRLCAVNTSTVNPRASVGTTLELATDILLNPPQTVTVTSASETTLVLDITESSSGNTPNDYVIVYRSDSTDPVTCSPGGAHSVQGPFAHAGTTTNATLIGLTAGTEYKIAVCSEIASPATQSDLSTVITATTAVAPPDPPLGLAPGTITVNSIQLTWTAPAGGADDYVVDYAQGATPPANCTSGTVTATTDIVINGLDENTDYSFAVCARNVTTESTVVSLASVTTNTLPPSADVTNLTIGNVASDSIELAYDAPDANTSAVLVQYDTSVAPPPSCPAPQITDTVLGDNRTVITGLTANTNYHIRVCTRNQSANSPQVTAGLTPSPVATPTPVLDNPTINGVTLEHDRIEFTWTPAAAPAHEVVITYQPGPTAPADCTTGNIAPMGNGNSTGAIGGLDFDTEYSFRICSRDSGGTVFSSGVLASNLRTTRNVPIQGFAFSNVAEETLDLNWADPPSGAPANGYRVFIHPGNVTFFNCSTSPTGDSASYSDVAGTSYSAMSLQAGQTYSFAICALNGNWDESAPVVPAVPTTTTANFVPTDPVFSSITDGSPGMGEVQIALSTAGDHAMNYLVAWLEGGTPPAPNCTNGSSYQPSPSPTLYVMGNFKPNTEYSFRVCTIAQGDIRSTGIIIPSHTHEPATPPPEVTTLNTTPSSTSIDLDWAGGDANTAGYRVVGVVGGTAPPDCDMASPPLISLDENTITIPFASVTGLNPGTQYSFRVCAVNDYGQFTAGFTVSATTGALNPGEVGSVGNLTAVAMSANDIQLNWQPAAQADAYRVYVAEGAPPEWGATTCNTTPAAQISGTTYNHTPGDPTLEQHFLVCGYNTTSGIASVEIATTSAFTLPPDITGIGSSSSYQDSIDFMGVTFTNGPESATGFTYSMAPSTPPGNCEDNGPSSLGNPVYIYELQPNTTYHFSVCAVNPLGEPSAIPFDTTITTKPARPTNVQFVPDPDGFGGTVSWTHAPGPNPDEYVVVYEPQSGSSINSQCSHSGAGEVFVPGSNSSVVISNLQDSTDWRVHVCARNTTSSETSMKESKDITLPHWRFQVQVSNHTTETLRLKLKDITQVVITHGDGSPASILGSTSGISYHEHTYAADGSYIVTFRGDLKGISVDCTASHNIINGLFSPMDGVTGLQDLHSLFRNCNNMNGVIPHNFLPAAAVANVTTVEDAFKGTAMTGDIPADLFAHAPKITNFTGTFQDSAFTSIPVGLFDNRSPDLNIKFDRTFAEMTLDGIVPTNLFFDAGSDVIRFDRTFMNVVFSNPDLAIPADLFANNPQVQDFISTFRNSNLRTIPVGLFDNNSNVEKYEATFQQTDVVVIPEGLFDSSAASTTSFKFLCSQCKHLESIPVDLFSNHINAWDFERVFLNHNMTEIPDLTSLFSSGTLAANNTDLAWAFSYDVAAPASSRPDNPPVTVPIPDYSGDFTGSTITTINAFRGQSNSGVLTNVPVGWK